MEDLSDFLTQNPELRPESPTRLALVHNSFRSASLARGVQRGKFSAHFPALGLLSLARAIRDDIERKILPPIEIKYFDEEAYPSETALIAEVCNWLDQGERRFIGVSSYTVTIDRLGKLLAAFDSKRYVKIVGGAHATTAPMIENAHLVVRGEGHKPLRHILNSFPSPAFFDPTHLKGIVFQFQGEQTVSPPRHERFIEEIPSPAFAYDLLPREDEGTQIYSTNFKRALGSKPMIYVCTQSCRARCTFCSTYLIHGKSVARPVEKVEADLSYLIKECGADSLEFHDDDLLQHPDLENLLTVIASFKVPWFCYGRVDSVTAHWAHRMAEAGCRRVFLGVEAMDQPTLDYFNKGSTVAQNKAAVACLDSVGIGVVAGFIIGAPHHTVHSILDQMDHYLQLPLMGVNVSILSPDPGTVEFLRAKKANPDFEKVSVGKGHSLRLMPNVALFGARIPVGLPTVCNAVDKQTLNDLVALIEAEFYLRPHIFDKMTKDLPSTEVDSILKFLDFQRNSLQDLTTRANSGTLPEVISTRVLQAANRCKYALMDRGVDYAA